MRGWDLEIRNDTGGAGETLVVLTFSNDPIWSDLRAGTIITVFGRAIGPISETTACDTRFSRSSEG